MFCQLATQIRDITVLKLMPAHSHCLIRITFLLVFLTQPKHMGPLRYENNRNIINKGDDEVR